VWGTTKSTLFALTNSEGRVPVAHVEDPEIKVNIEHVVRKEAFEQIRHANEKMRLQGSRSGH